MKSVLKFGLKHGILIRLKESESVAIMEDFYEQIVRQDLLKKDNISKYCIQTAFRSFTYSYLNLKLKNYGLNQNKMKILWNLKDRCMILKPDKGQGIVLINKSDYYNWIERLIFDKSRFEVVSEDPTLRKLSKVQNSLNSLFLWGETTEE